MKFFYKLLLCSTKHGYLSIVCAATYFAAPCCLLLGDVPCPFSRCSRTRLQPTRRQGCHETQPREREREKSCSLEITLSDRLGVCSCDNRCVRVFAARQTRRRGFGAIALTLARDRAFQSATPCCECGYYGATARISPRRVFGVA